MPRLRVFLSALIAAASTGCVTYRAKPLDPVASQAQLESRRLDEAGLRRFLAAHGQPVVEQWDLSRLTLAAFYFNPEIEVARAQVEEAEAGIRTAEAKPNPTFAFTPGRSDDTTGGLTPWILGYALNLPLELAGKRAHRTAEAQRRAERARLGLAARAWSVHSGVRRALIDLEVAEAESGIGQDHVPLVAQSARILAAQVAAGDGSPQEAAAARVVAARAELALRAGERAVSQARSRLAEAIGVPLAALAGLRFSYAGILDTRPPLAPQEARAWAAQNRADLLMALSAYAVAQSALQSEVARQYPDLTLGPGYQLDQGEGKWSLGLGVTLPVFHLNQGPIAAAEARRAGAAAQFLAVQNRILAEVDRASADYSSASAELETVRTLRAALERQITLLRSRQEAGDSSRLDLLRAEIEKVDHVRAALAVRQRALHALGALEDAVQRPLAWPESAWRAPARLSEAR